MDVATRDAAHRAEASEERTLIALEALGAVLGGDQRNGCADQMHAHPVPVQERIRKLPEALLLTAGYYAGRVPTLAELLRRRR